jgi:hypothetical protein
MHFYLTHMIFWKLTPRMTSETQLLPSTILKFDPSGWCHRRRRRMCTCRRKKVLEPNSWAWALNIRHGIVRGVKILPRFLLTSLSYFLPSSAALSFPPSPFIVHHTLQIHSKLQHFCNLDNGESSSR